MAGLSERRARLLQSGFADEHRDTARERYFGFVRVVREDFASQSFNEVRQRKEIAGWSSRKRGHVTLGTPDCGAEYVKNIAITLHTLSASFISSICGRMLQFTWSVHMKLSFEVDELWG